MILYIVTFYNNIAINIQAIKMSNIITHLFLNNQPMYTLFTFIMLYTITYYF